MRGNNRSYVNNTQCSDGNLVVSTFRRSVVGDKEISNSSKEFYKEGN